MKQFLNRFVEKFKELSPTVQGFIIIGILLVIGIVIRWNYIIEQVKNSIDFLNGK